jgi:hypothetical protein
MAIPEAQLKTWSAQGSIQQSSTTYATIKRALEADDTSYTDKKYEVFLQGSYGNDTNVFADSDVDIVIKLNSSFYRDISRLPPEQTQAYKASFSGAAYGNQDLKIAVTAALNTCFGDDVHLGTKAIWIKPNAGRRNADVLVCSQFRRYHEFHSDSNQRYDEGIGFFSGGKLIENFPKQHSKNLTTKHQETAQRLKPMVRIFKNMRNNMISKKMLAEGVAPSYFIEGMLYNVPKDLFTNTYADTFTKCHDWLSKTDQTKLVCANYMHWLIRPNEHTSWAPDNFARFMNATQTFWNKGG